MRLHPDDPETYLRQLGESGQVPHDIARAALMLAALDHADHDLKPYIAHLAEIAEQARLEARLSVHAEHAARSLAALLAGSFGYDGDRVTYDDPRNADLIAVIDRRRGMPVALGVLYLHAARAAGFEASGLNSPGHFLLRIRVRGSEALIDPFNGGAALEQESLGAPPLMRELAGEDLDPMHSVEDIDILLRLENNLKLRAARSGEYRRALEIARRMALIAPKNAGLRLDIAHFREQLGELGAARSAFGTCLALAKPGTTLHNEATLGLDGLKRRLN
ncbi:MAG TPA: tetratricopeptide repeat protein [Rhizomicrobium sp.]|jgi:regulator of sirC expression with transglutaminase-like and TPR domain